MKILINFIYCSFFIALIGIISCKKETSCEGCATKNNKPPTAVAGPDQLITLPTDSVLVDGRSSSDPDGTINSYLWTKISGPTSFNIIKQSDSVTKVKALVAGTYLFELKVTDNGGLSAKDTMRVIVDPVLTTNHPPIANAGIDQVITLPTNAVNLDGSASTDPDNNITTYAWTKISGPSSFNIVNSNAVQTQITNLIQGAYNVELKVTDAGGLISQDTMQIIVNSAVSNNCSLSQTLIGSLSIPRSNVNILEAGNKIVFAGGFASASGPPLYGASSRVDIYDRGSQTWSMTELSLTRFHMGTTSLGNKIYFAGGDNGQPCSRIDIYDASSNIWTIAELSEAREGVIAITAGNKVLFAGGIASTGGSKKVDIYDQPTNTWSTASLSYSTSGDYPGQFILPQSGAITVNNKIYFMLGNNNVDIYDAITNTWSTHVVSPNELTQSTAVSIAGKVYFSGAAAGSTTIDYNYANTLEIFDISADSWSSVNMSQSRAYMAAIAGDGKIFWSGGFDSSWDVNGEQAIRPLTNIEIYDVTTGLHSFHDLQQQEWWVQALKTSNKIFFSYGNYTETYDMINHTWTICSKFLFHPLAFGNTIYQVGADDSRVWKLEF